MDTVKSFCQSYECMYSGTVPLTHCVHVNCTIRQDLKEAGVSWRKNKSTVLTEKIGINVSLTWAEWTVSMNIVKSFCKVC